MKTIARKRGFTLSEMLMTSVIMAVVLCVLLVEFVNCIFLNETSRHLTLAVAHAQYVMEDIKSSSFNSVRDNGDSLWDWDTAAIESRDMVPLKNESIDTETSGTDLLTVAVTVNWQGRGSRSRSWSLQTLLTRP
jgi:prepilin-type N-terminal cleavage/methylation domain-containing protein